MASKEEIQKKNIEEANELLSEQINLTAALNDSMSFLLKIYKEKGTLDKQSLDLSKQAINITKNLKSEYESIKDVEKDISKNKKTQNDINKQVRSLEKQGGQALKDEISMLKTKESSLAKAQEKLAKMESDKKLGKKVDEALYKQAQDTLIKKEEQLRVANEILTPEAQQVLLLTDAGKVLEDNNKYLDEQLRRQENLNKSSSLFTSTLMGANKALGKLGFGNLSSKLGLEAASKKAEELTYTLTEGGKKSLGMFGKLRVGVASFGAALKSALGPMALIGMAVSLFNKFKEIGKEAAEAMKAVDQSTKDLGRDLGVSNKVATQVAGSAMSIGSAMGVTSDIAIGSAKSIYSALDGAEQVSKKTLGTFMKLNIFAGMSADSLAGVYKFAKLSGEEASTVAENIATTAQESIKTQKVNVSMKQVMDGVSKTSNIMKLNFGGSAKGLTEAFIASKKLGLELGKVEDIANSLLNIEDSIAAEMEAELLTGKDLNLEKAREAALNNDTKGLMEEIANQFGSIEDFQKMNRIQQEAFAKSIGMSREGLADMLVASKENQATNTKNVDAQQQSLNAMMSMASIGERLAAQEEAKNLAAANAGKEMMAFEKNMLAIETAGRKILDNVFGPIGESANGILGTVAEWLSNTDNINMISEKIRVVVDGIKYVFGEVWGFVRPIAETLGNLALNILPILKGVWETIKPIVMNIKDFIAEILGSVGSLIEKLTTGNGEFTTMEKTVGIIAAGIGGFLISLKAIKLAQEAWNKATLVYQGIRVFIEGLNKKEEGSLLRRIALGFRDAAAAALKAVAQVTGMSAATLGIAAGIALAAGAAAAIYFSSQESAAKSQNAGDLFSGPQGGGGYGKRMLVAPEGTFALNNNDTVIAGTSLFKGDDVVSAPAGSVSMGGNDALVTEMKEIKNLLKALVSKQGDVMMDSTKVGKALMLAGYQIS
jgi:hypothetical protein